MGYILVFSQYLKNKISISGKTRELIIKELSIFSQEFELLDPVSLNRWINGRVTPHIYKQLLLCLYFNDDMLWFISNVVENKSTPKNFNKMINSFFFDLKNCYSIDSYFFQKKGFFKKKLTDIYTPQIRDGLDIYNSNFDYARYINEVISMDNTVKKIITYETTIDNIIISHSIFFYALSIETINHINDYFNINIKGRKILLTGGSNIRNFDFFSFSLKKIIHYCIKNNLVKYEILFISRHNKLNNILLGLGAEKIKSNNEVSLYVVEIIKLISHPFILNLLIH